MLEGILNLLGELLFWKEDYNFNKRKKARRKFEQENNLPKKIMIHPTIKIFGIIIILVVISKITFGIFIFSDFGTKQTKKKLSRIYSILQKEKMHSGIYPEKLNIIVRNNPLRKKIIYDYWGNEFFYKTTENGGDYIIISKGKDGILKTKDDIKGN